MSDKKLSLHIGEKNIVSINSGFTDVSATFIFDTSLSLNRQMIVDFDNGFDSVAVTGTIAGATRTVGRTTQQSSLDCWGITVTQGHSTC